MMQIDLMLAGIGLVAYAGTDVDDLFLLVAFFADRSVRPRHVVAGQFLGMGALIGASVAASLLALLIPAAYTGLLGAIPFGLGVARLVWPAAVAQDGEPGTRPGSIGILSIAAVTIANGGDNLATYIPLFASKTGPEVAFLVALFLGLTGVWLLAGYWLVRHPAVSGLVRRYGSLVLPWILIALGGHIMISADILSLFR
jgi:cadmium resistance protein CadD (predicted permease)